MQSQSLNVKVEDSTQSTNRHSEWEVMDTHEWPETLRNGGEERCGCQGLQMTQSSEVAAGEEECEEIHIGKRVKGVPVKTKKAANSPFEKWFKRLQMRNQREKKCPVCSTTKYRDEQKAPP